MPLSAFMPWRLLPFQDGNTKPMLATLTDKAVPVLPHNSQNQPAEKEKQSSSLARFLFVQYITNHIHLRNFECVADFNAMNITIINQVICQMSANTEHILQLLNIDNVGILWKHQSVDFFGFYNTYLLLHVFMNKILKGDVND